MANVGFDGIGGTEYRVSQDWAWLCWFTFPSAGNVSQISVYTKADTDGAGNRIRRVGVYDTGINLIGQGGNTDWMTTTPQWHNFTVDIDIPAGGTYGIAFQTDINDHTQYSDAGSVAQTIYDDQDGALPNPFVSAGSENKKCSIYATFTASETVQSVSDSLGLADVVDVVSPNKIVADALAIAESVLVHKELKIADTLSLADLISGSFGYLFKIGLEPGDLSEFDGVSGDENVTVTDSKSHHSTYCMEVSDSSSAYKTVDDASTERYECYQVMISRFPDDWQEFAISNCYGSGQNIAIEFVGSVGYDALILYSPGFFEYKWYNAKADFAPNVWHKIQVYIKEGTGDAQVIVKVDGIPRVTTPNDLTITHITGYQYGLINPYGETGGDITINHDCIGLTLTDSGDLFEEGAPPAGQQLFTLINEMGY